MNDKVYFLVLLFENVLSKLKVKRSITANVFGNIDLFCYFSCWLPSHNQDSYLRSKKMMKLAKELTTANSLVNDSESEDEAVLFEDNHQDVPVIVTLNQKIQSLNNNQERKTFLMSFIYGLEHLLKINQQKYLLKLILCIFL